MPIERVASLGDRRCLEWLSDVPWALVGHLDIILYVFKTFHKLLVDGPLQFFILLLGFLENEENQCF